MQQQRTLASIILLVLCAVTRVSAQGSYSDRAQQYIQQYKQWAMDEQRRTGVPAAITLAQGIHETSGGQSELAENANNHFGIKCKKEWTGETYRYTDDAPNECFRKYESVLNSYRDHSDYLLTSPRYAALFKLDVKDYKGWAQGLKRCGYATNPKYAFVLIKLVEEHGLNDFTVAALTPAAENPYQQNTLAPGTEIRTASVQKEIVPDQDAPPVAAPLTAGSPVIAGADVQVNMGKKNRTQVSYEQGRTLSDLKNKKQEPVTDATVTADGYGTITTVNGLKAFYAKKGTVLLNESIKHDIRYAKLLELNDLPDAPLEADMYIYLEKKHTTGEHATYIVNEGETLTQIAQKEGIQLKYLKGYNKIGANEEPMPGAVLQLLDYVTVKPATRPRTLPPMQKQAVAMRDDVGRKAQADEDAFISKADLGKGRKETRTISKEIISPVREVFTAQEQPVVLAEARIAPMELPALKLPETEKEEIAPEPANATASSEQPAVSEPEPVVADTMVVAASNNAEPAPTANETDTSAVVYTEVDVDDPSDTVATEEIAVASDTTIEELIKLAHEEAGNEADDEYTKLKKKLDKVVYASNKAAEANDELKKEAKQIQKDVKEGKASAYYTVKKGDTAFSIAKKHKITMSQLMEWNKLDFKEIKAGQQLRVK